MANFCALSTNMTAELNTAQVHYIRVHHDPKTHKSDLEVHFPGRVQPLVLTDADATSLQAYLGNNTLGWVHCVATAGFQGWIAIAKIQWCRTHHDHASGKADRELYFMGSATGKPDITLTDATDIATLDSALASA